MVRSSTRSDPEERTMYPIEREDYINAYISAISDEMRQSRQTRRAARTSPGTLNRLYESVAGMLKRGAAGTGQTANPQPVS